MTAKRFGYVYGGMVTFNGLTRTVDGTAWSLGRCDEVRLRAVAVRDLSQTEGVPLAEIELTDFWYSEIITDRDAPPDPDPFSPHRDVSGDDAADPFRPRPGHPCTGDM